MPVLSAALLASLSAPILALSMQVGPAPTQPSSPSAVPPELGELRERQRAAQREEEREEQAARGGSARQTIAACHAKAVADSVAAETDAEGWLAVARGEDRATAQHCLGLALANQSRWADAAEAFQTGYGLLPETRGLERAQLAALAGNARLAQGKPQQALDLLDAAALLQIPAKLSGEIALDRARAMVALGRMDEAARTLAAAREVSPRNPLAWLLSATLSRRSDDLAAAQSQIERAAALDPADPAIGLEAGVIAALAGRDDAARASWQSVIALAPESVQAETARGYLSQLAAPETAE